ncbi:transcriptional regulator [[Clostridium] sordellii]|nr:transcriptional regulator [[Clostridium] sordellii] [Paeniclostridium sordellii]
MNDIMSLILEKQRATILEMKIASLLTNNLSSNDIRSTLNYINYYFLKFTTSIYCTSNKLNYNFDNNLINLLSKSKFTSCINFKNDLLILITYNDINKSKVNKTIEFYIDLLKDNVPDYIIGVSDNYIPITSCKNAINQALLSCKSCSLNNNSIIYYSSLGIYSLIINFKDFDEFRELYASIIDPIKKYDSENNSDLLQTLISFVNNDGDFKKVSKELFQHENTVRYRILKIRSLLNLEKSHIEFFEKISIGIKLHKIYNN